VGAVPKEKKVLLKNRFFSPGHGKETGRKNRGTGGGGGRGQLGEAVFRGGGQSKPNLDPGGGPPDKAKKKTLFSDLLARGGAQRGGGGGGGNGPFPKWGGLRGLKKPQPKKLAFIMGGTGGGNAGILWGQVD